MRILCNQRKWADTLFLSGFTLVSFVFFNLLITAALLAVKIPVLGCTPVLSLVFAEGCTILVAKKQFLLQDRLQKSVAVIMPVVLIIGSVLLAMVLVDRSYDGNYYHKAAIGGLANGWNPVYEGLMEFRQRTAFQIPVSVDDCLWADHYAKTSYFYAAPMYVLTGSIEAGKSINLISVLGLFLLWCGYFLYKEKKPLYVLLVSGMIVSCPVFGTQMFSNYIDLLVGVYLFVIILVFFVFEEEEYFGRSVIVHTLLFMCLCVMINIKFSSFGYAGLFCMGYYLWYLYRTWKKELEMKELLRLTATAAAAVAVGVLVIGFSVYVKNFVDHGHPFYPLFGDGKVDIMEINQPQCFVGMSALEKFFYATFSYAENIDAAAGTLPVLKFPFTVTEREIASLTSIDLRISGYGVLFGGILIICAAVWCGTVKTVYRNNKRLFTLTSIPLVITLAMVLFFGESWWARYFPQLYLFPVFMLLYLDENPNFIKKALCAVLIGLLFVNNGLTMGTNTLATVRKTAEIKAQFDVMEQAAAQSDGIIVLKAGKIRGALYNALDAIDGNNVYVVQSDSDPYAQIATESAYLDFVYWGIVNE